ncbi:MAG TPA: lysyl oxidase family protein [Nocardioidaceae bacterium]|nr:lysyl oxidase family protein [Nocardioidaceae bacterium]
MPSRRSLATTGAAIAALVATTLVGGAGDPARSAEPTSPISLWAPKNVTTYQYRGRIWADDLGLRVIAGNESFEVHTSRPSYDDPVQAIWKSAGGDVVLPTDPKSTIGALGSFLSFEIRREGSDTVRRVKRKACLGGWAERRDPAANATSPYPRSCFYNLYAIGGLQGVQAGWASRLTGIGMMHVDAGRYQVTARITQPYADALGLSAEDRTRTFTLDVQGYDDGGVVGHHRAARTVASPNSAPTSARAGVIGDYLPDLRSVPAWGIAIARKGRSLRFAATVWNDGNSPLVVDGFRRADEDEMDAYQYFFDGAGNQTGYQLVGEMHWDAKPSHQHWHFRDFAKYTLVDANKVQLVRSKKEAFCLANTDAVDLSNPAADWTPENTDLATACGDLTSLSIREVLAAGWGDTYSQTRAGQAFDISELPNGTYYIAVIANPKHRLVESDTTNNVAYRKIVLKGRGVNRTVTAEQVGMIVEPKIRYY